MRFLNHADHHLERITKADEDFANRLGFKDIKLPVNIRDILKIEKKNSIDISVFGYEHKEKHPIYLSKKCCEDKHVDLLLKGEGKKKHYVLIKTLIQSCVIIHYIGEGTIFVVIVYMLLLQKKF